VCRVRARGTPGRLYTDDDTASVVKVNRATQHREALQSSNRVPFSPRPDSNGVAYIQLVGDSVSNHRCIVSRASSSSRTPGATPLLSQPLPKHIGAAWTSDLHVGRMVLREVLLFAQPRVRLLLKPPLPIVYGILHCGDAMECSVWHRHPKLALACCQKL
jgi:hypothetical protein